MQDRNAKIENFTPPGYEVTEDGSVYSVSSNWRGYGKRKMRTHLDQYGYPLVRLTVDGKRKNYRVHRLVADKYLGSKPSARHQIRHLDGDKLNNHRSNLAWGTAKENADDRSRHGMTCNGVEHGKRIKAGWSRSPYKLSNRKATQP